MASGEKPVGLIALFFAVKLGLYAAFPADPAHPLSAAEGRGECLGGNGPKMALAPAEIP